MLSHASPAPTTTDVVRELVYSSHLVNLKRSIKFTIFPKLPPSHQSAETSSSFLSLEASLILQPVTPVLSEPTSQSAVGSYSASISTSPRLSQVMNSTREFLHSPTDSQVPSSVPSRIDFQIPNFGQLQTPIETCDPENYQPPTQDDIPIWPHGWRPWACLFGCFLLMFNSWGLVNAYGTFASYYSTNHLQGSTTILLNLVGSTQSFIVLILSTVAGRLLDAGYARKLILLGTSLITLGMFCLSAVKPLNYGGIWAAQGLCVGLGMACFFVSSSQG